MEVLTSDMPKKGGIFCSGALLPFNHNRKLIHFLGVVAICDDNRQSNISIYDNVGELVIEAWGWLCAGLFHTAPAGLNL